MPLSTAAKAALCLCPPAAMVGTVATVPAAKRAVHHLTAPHHARPVARHVAATPAGGAVRRADCNPVVAGAPPVVPLVTYAAPIPDEPVTGGSSGGPGGALGPATSPIGALAAVPPVTAATPTPVPTNTPAVPEPASWALMIVGAGTIGATLRRRRRGERGGKGLAASAGLWGATTAADAGEVAATVAAKTTVTSGVAAKALLCACPAALVAGSVATVPPLRHAVHTATAPAAIPAAPVVGRATVPCDPSVPVSATAVPGFPDTVVTQPAVRAGADRPAAGASLADSLAAAIKA